MHQVIKGSEPIEIRTPPVIQISIDLAVSTDDFFSPGELIHNLAFVLGIDPRSIRIVDIVSEATLLRTRRAIANGVNRTTITLEFGDPPAQNVTVAEAPSIAEEIAMAGETNDSVDLMVQLVIQYECRYSNCMHAVCMCIHVFLSACMHACVHACIRACMHACVHASCVRACVHAWMHACMCTCVCACILN